jgi:hypothetical protein
MLATAGVCAIPLWLPSVRLSVAVLVWAGRTKPSNDGRGTGGSCGASDSQHEELVCEAVPLCVGSLMKFGSVVLSREDVVCFSAACCACPTARQHDAVRHIAACQRPPASHRSTSQLRTHSSVVPHAAHFVPMCGGKDQYALILHSGCVGLCFSFLGKVALVQ